MMSSSVSGDQSKSKSQRRQIILISTVGFAYLVNSMALGFTSPALPQLYKDTHMKITEEVGSWIASITPGGAILGSLVASFIVNHFGSRNLLAVSMLAFVGSWIGIADSHRASSIIVCRFLAGVCVGLSSSSGAVYLAETVREDFRPQQALITAAFGTFGFLLMSSLSTFLSWRSLAWAGAMLCLPPLLCPLYLPESPYHLFKTSPEHAKRALKWITSSESNAKKKLKEVEYSLRLIRKTKRSSSKADRYPLRVLLTLHVIQQMTGINVFIFFSTDLFSEISKNLNADAWAVYLTIVNVVSNIVSARIQGWCERKTLLKVSTNLLALCLWIIAFFFMMKESKRFGEEFIPFVYAVPTLSIMVYIVAFAIGWGPVPFLFMGEGLPSTIRGNATGVAMTVNWSMAFIVTKSFFWMSELIGLGWTFLVYSMFTVGGGLLMEHFMPETLEKSITEMDAFYANREEIINATE